MYNLRNKAIEFIDAPVIKMAQKTISLAVSLGMLDKDWRERFEG